MGYYMFLVLLMSMSCSGQTCGYLSPVTAYLSTLRIISSQCQTALEASERLLEILKRADARTQSTYQKSQDWSSASTKQGSFAELPQRDPQ